MLVKIVGTRIKQSESRIKENETRRKKIDLRRFLKRCSASLNSNLPPSERWFHKHWSAQGLASDNDELNRPWLGSIPDVVNHKERYVIEVDGKSHDSIAQKEIDAKKDTKFTTNGYAVFRVRAYDINSLLDAAAKIRERRWYAARRGKH